MKIEKYGEGFEVTFIDDDCKIEVNYKGVGGRVEVLNSGTNSSPYGWSIGTRGVSSFETPQLALDGLCKALIDAYLRAEGQKAFKREQACEELRKFGRSLDE